ncbi:hypothetical protein ACFPOI_37325, partial [Nonomuraea angiospora]
PIVNTLRYVRTPYRSYLGLTRLGNLRRLTLRLCQATSAVIGDGGRTVIQSARDHGVSWPIVSAAFTAHARRVLPAQPKSVTVPGIDEVRRGRAR